MNHKSLVFRWKVSSAGSPIPGGRENSLALTRRGTSVHDGWHPQPRRPLLCRITLIYHHLMSIVFPASPAFKIQKEQSPQIRVLWKQPPISLSLFLPKVQLIKANNEWLPTPQTDRPADRLLFRKVARLFAQRVRRHSRLNGNYRFTGSPLSLSHTHDR